MFQINRTHLVSAVALLGVLLPPLVILRDSFLVIVLTTVLLQHQVPRQNGQLWCAEAMVALAGLSILVIAPIASDAGIKSTLLLQGELDNYMKDLVLSGYLLLMFGSLCWFRRHSPILIETKTESNDDAHNK